MAHRLTIAATASCTAGAILAGDGVWRHTWELATTGLFLLGTGLAGVLAATFRYTLRQFETRTRKELHDVTERRRLLDEEMRARDLDLSTREEAMRRREMLTRLRVGSYALALDQSRDDNMNLVARNAALELEINEVNDERNQLISAELLLANDQFTSKMYGSLRIAAGGDAPARLPRLPPLRKRDFAPQSLVRDHEV